MNRRSPILGRIATFIRVSAKEQMGTTFLLPGILTESALEHIVVNSFGSSSHKLLAEFQQSTLILTTTPQVGPTRKLIAPSAMPTRRFISWPNLWLTQSIEAHWPNIIERMSASLPAHPDRGC